MAKSSWLLIGLLFLMPAAHAETEHQTQQGVSGTLNIVGSDTMASLVSHWQESFKKHYPRVNIQLQAMGSGSVPPALLNASTMIGAMSRKMTQKEISQFTDKFSYLPLELIVAIDAPGVYVHKDNPLQSISLAQLDAIFSATRKCGESAAITQWKQLGVEGDLGAHAIQLFGRNAVSGTYNFFKEHALCNGDFRANVNEQPGSSSIVEAISHTPNAIGYAGIGYQNSGVKALAVAKKNQPAIEPNAENALSGKYPLARPLYLYINKAPDHALAPLEQDFLKLVLSEPGQTIVSASGYFPLPEKIAARELKKID